MIRSKFVWFFDLDNTMLQGASVYYLARGLAARKFFTGRDLIRFGFKQLRFRIVATEHGGHVSQAREAALAFVEGRRVDELAGLAEEIFDELMAERIWSGTHALARIHLESGQRVWLVTAAPVEIGLTDITWQCWAMGNPSVAEPQLNVIPTPGATLTTRENPNALLSISWQVAANITAPVPFDFCVSDIKPLFAAAAQ